ncbi:HipA family kinase [Klenkia marina]|uniref:HipA family kinase n=1 Tax=Klenkia marina TaxID=1960309 RepID=UPI0010595D18|nr:HipA family kinase [Klenkia marina]
MLLTDKVAGSLLAPFEVQADDENLYWVKSSSLLPPAEPAALVKEYVVARAGALIGAPVCRSTLIRIPPDLDGEELRDGMFLKAGLAHGSLAVERADERGRPYLVERKSDDNVRRHARIYALFDWCCGSDAQWLYDIDDNLSIYSHDHGRYLPPMDTGFLTRAALEAEVGRDNSLTDSPVGLNANELMDVASDLLKVSENDLLTILKGVPASWPVDDETLGALGWFLFERREGVAQRLMQLTSRV